MWKGGGTETEVTWEDQQNINKFGRLNNRFHELEDEIKIAKVKFFIMLSALIMTVQCLILFLASCLSSISSFRWIILIFMSNCGIFRG